MRKKFIFLALGPLLLALSPFAEAQQPKKVFHIGYMSSVTPSADAERAEAIRRALRELGYVEKQNIFTEYRYSEGKRERHAEHAAELVRLNVDLIIVSGGETLTEAAKNATKTIPIVMVGAGVDPVAAGFVDSLARPGRNVTGITNITTALGGKRLELLKEAIPKITRVAVLLPEGREAEGGRRQLAALKENLPVSARALGLAVRFWDVRDTKGFELVFAALNKERSDALYVPPLPLMRENRKQIIDFASASRLPSLFESRDYVEAGGLMSYGADRANSYRRVAYFVDRILKGAKPADLPVEQPKKFEFVNNLKAAKQIGVTIPPTVLARADKVIK